MRHLSLSAEQQRRFEADGFLIIENFLDRQTINTLASRFEPLFSGEFETGIQPDEWNWRFGRDADDLTRQICNGWKADYAIAATVLREDIGAICAQLRGWNGARINQDNVIWKPPGARALGFHQDESYQSWILPAEMMTCWMTLDDTHANHGTIEYVKGSHRWPLSPPIATFHAPDDPLADLHAAAHLSDLEPEIVPVVVPAGSAVFHHGRTWHGSGHNHGTGIRRSVVSHCMSSDARFHEVNTSPVYSRYRKVGCSAMEESFFPILWREDGYRSPFLDS